MKKKQTEVFTIQAPCKINLHLSVGKRRADGFHSLRSIFVPLALSDTLEFEYGGSTGESSLSIRWQTSAQQIKPEDNLVLKAVSLFRKRTGFSSALNIRLVKRIPAGAGLGGASSDAASALTALNYLAGNPVSPPRLAAMAAVLGSDVPFFLGGGAAFVSGRGERIRPLKSPGGLWALLVKPPFSSDTARAYRLLDEARASGLTVAGKKLSRQILTGALENAPESWPFYNDFLPVLQRETGAVYRDILDNLRGAGASFAALSGSGSCCFGIFTSEEKAKKAKKALSGGKNGVNLTFFLA